MDKQKRIEEIEQFLARKILGGRAWNTRDIATSVYELITKNAVVLTREDHDYLINDCKRWEKLAVEKVDEIITTRKETIEKFVEMLKSDVSEDNELHEALNYYLKRDYFEYIDERCRELMEGK